MEEKFQRGKVLSVTLCRECLPSSHVTRRYKGGEHCTPLYSRLIENTKPDIQKKKLSVPHE